MSLQDWFYTLGIFYMSITLIFYLILIVTIFVIKNKIDSMHKVVGEKIQQIQKFTGDPTQAAIAAGSFIANRAIKKAKKILK